MMRDLFLQAYSAMRYNARRTTLTMLGMAWGIATVVLLLAYGEGFGRAIDNIFANFGAKVIGIFPGRTSMQAGGSKAGTEIKLELEDVERIAVNVPVIKRISPEVAKEAIVSNDNRSFKLTASGVYPAMQRIRALNIEEGRLLTEQDRLNRARVAVIGSEAKTKLFSGQYALGQSIRVDGVSFEVVGVLAAKMQEGNDNINKMVYIPFTTMGDLKDTQYLDGIWLDYEVMDYEKVEQSVRATLAAVHNFKPDDRRAVMMFNAFKQVTQFHIISMGLKVLLAFIGTITLGIGGVGLMNIMLVSVSQRTREIGVEKALGAKKHHILTQFMAEAMVITFAGGVAGIILAYLISWSAGTLTLYSAIAKNAEAGDIRLIIDPVAIVVSTIILVFVGLISGMLPAIKAANLDPIEALRYE